MSDETIDALQEIDALHRRVSEMGQALARLESWPAYTQWREEQQSQQRREALTAAAREVDASQEERAQASLAGGKVLLRPGVWRCRNGDTVWLEGARLRVQEPAGPEELLQARRDFHRRVLEPLEKDFEALKSALEGRGRPWRWPADGRYGPDPSSSAEALERLQSLVRRERDELDALGQDPDELARQRLKDEAARNRREVLELMGVQAAAARKAVSKIITSPV